MDRLHNIAEALSFNMEHTGGGIWAAVHSTDAGTVVVTDDVQEVIIGYYPGDDWQTGNVDNPEYVILSGDLTDADLIAQVRAFAKAHA